jgi:prepilin signal peptidase PulO-like enzyme (type II secretory pathway)
MLRGRCADCKAAIHIQYPLVEGAAVMLAVVTALRHDPFASPFLFFGELILILGFLVPVVMDIRWKELPIEYLVILGIFGSVMRVFGTTEVMAFAQIMFDVLLPVVVASAFFGLQVFVSKGRWMGSGDIWFGGMMGAILGWPGVLVGVYLAYVIGGMVALFGLAFKIYKRGDRLPFAPALALGTLIAYWYGPQLLSLFSL